MCQPVSLDDKDLLVRGRLTQAIARLGRAPSTRDLAEDTGLSETETRNCLCRLQNANALLLHPNSERPWIVHPFALSPSACWVQTRHHGYWASCLYCGFGIAACLKQDAKITTRYGGEARIAHYDMRDGEIESDDVFHLSIPVRNWWDNVIHACASFQPFRSEAEIDQWCERHDMGRGAVLTIPALWHFAKDWYGNYLDDSWRKRSREDIKSIFASHGLTSEFWDI